MLTERQRISPEKISLFFVFVFFTALTFVCRNIPFFWDGDLFSQEAHFYFTNNFSGIILPPELDRDGTPVLFAAYFAAVWKLLGKTLLVSHLAMLPVLLGIAWEYYKLSKKFLREGMIPFAMLLLLFDPTFITQSIVMGYDVALLYFFLLALNALLSRRGMLYGTALSLLGLCSIRGIMLAITLLLIHVAMRIVIEKKFNARELKFYVMPFLVLSGAALWHYYKTGWFFISSSPVYLRDRTLVSFNMLIRQGIYVVWYIGDFGRAFILVFVSGAFAYAFILKKKFMDNVTKHVAIITVIAIVMHVVFLSPFSNPIAHRYFLNIIVFLPLVLCFVLQQINLNRKIFLAVYSVFCIGLLTGNFWYYGGGFSNGWDSSLKSLPYFKLKTEMMNFVREQKINPEEIASKFPVPQDTYYTDLTSDHFKYTDMENIEPGKFKYILLSNISNQFAVQEKKMLSIRWIVMKELNAGQVYLKLLKNPRNANQ